MFDDAQDAAQLIALGMRPKQLPARDIAYMDLVRRYDDDGSFAGVVDAIASGFELKVLSVNRQSGIVLGAREDSVFATKFDDYAKRTALSGRAADKVIHGITHLAVAALAFPRPDDLANDTYVGRVSIASVDVAVLDACRKLTEQAEAADENHDPLAMAPDLERAWRAYQQRPKAAQTKDKRLNEASTRGMVSKAVRFLAEQGLLTKRSDDDGGTYLTTPRYQVQVRELASTAAYDELLALGVATPLNPEGSLQVATEPTMVEE